MHHSTLPTEQTAIDLAQRRYDAELCLVACLCSSPRCTLGALDATGIGLAHIEDPALRIVVTAVRVMVEAHPTERVTRERLCLFVATCLLNAGLFDASETRRWVCGRWSPSTLPRLFTLNVEPIDITTAIRALCDAIADAEQIRGAA